MRKRRFFLLVAAYVLFGVWSGILLGFISVDGFWAPDRIVGDHVTIVPEGYSDAAFRAIRPGMTEEEVVGRLGLPLLATTWDFDAGVRTTTDYRNGRRTTLTCDDYPSLALFGGGASGSFTCYSYSAPTKDGCHLDRFIVFRGGLVSAVRGGYHRRDRDYIY